MLAHDASTPHAEHNTYSSLRSKICTRQVLVGDSVMPYPLRTFREGQSSGLGHWHVVNGCVESSTSIMPPLWHNVANRLAPTLPRCVPGHVSMPGLIWKRNAITMLPHCDGTYDVHVAEMVRFDL